MKKKCTACKKLLPLSDFWKEKEGKYGVKSQCKKCHYKYRAKNKKYIVPKYAEGELCKISYCECGKLLAVVDYPQMKNIIRPIFKETKHFKKKHLRHDGLCSKCFGNKTKEERKQQEIEWELSHERRLKKNRIRKNRRSWWLCAVCGQAIAKREYYVFEDHEIEGLEYYTPKKWPGCSKDCNDKIEYALSVRNTGINGIGIRTFGNIFSPDIKEYDWWLKNHKQYKMALLAKRFKLFKKERIKITKTLRSIENGTIRTRNQRTQANEYNVDGRENQTVRSKRTNSNLQSDRKTG